MKVKKAIIPTAGLGTRFLPVTKAVPKEMLPIIDTPVLFYIVDEAVRAGIEDIVLITGRGKGAIEDFFDCSYEVEDQLKKNGKHEVVEALKKIRNMANIISIRQKEALGLGHAVYCGSPVVGDDPFAVLLGDEIMFSDPSTPTTTGQLAQIFHETQRSAVAVMHVERTQVEKYGIVAGKKNSANQIEIEYVVEKPKPEEAPSQFALPGRYVFSSKIFAELKNAKPGKNGEIQLTDAMTAIAKTEGMLGAEFLAKRYDTGDKLGFIKANVEIGLTREDLGTELKNYIKQLAGSL